MSTHDLYTCSEFKFVNIYVTNYCHLDGSLGVMARKIRDFVTQEGAKFLPDYYEHRRRMIEDIRETISYCEVRPQFSSDAERDAYTAADGDGKLAIIQRLSRINPLQC